MGGLLGPYYQEMLLFWGSTPISDSKIQGALGSQKARFPRPLIDVDPGAQPLMLHPEWLLESLKPARNLVFSPHPAKGETCKAMEAKAQVCVEVLLAWHRAPATSLGFRV